RLGCLHPGGTDHRLPVRRVATTFVPYRTANGVTVSSRTRWTRHLSVWRAVTAVSLATSAVLMASAPGGAVSISTGNNAGMEIDGNQTVEGGLDWLNNSPIIATDNDALANSGFQGTSMELEPSAWVCNTGGANPAKGNVLRTYRKVRVTGTNTYLDLAAVREDTNGVGEVTVEFELNQGPASTCSFTRTTGDLLVAFDFPGGNPPGPASINLFRWVDGPGVPPQPEGTWDPVVPNVAAFGAVNLAAITAPNDATGTAIAAGHFVEASLDLTALINGVGQLPCAAFQTLNARSRSSNAINSALQDRILPVALNLCPGVPQQGRIIIDKVTSPAGSTQLFTFTPSGFNGNAQFQLADGSTPFDSGPLTPTNVPNPPTYAVSEGGLGGWMPPVSLCSNGSPVNDIEVGEGETVTCTFINVQLNPPPLGRIIVDKVTDPAGSPDEFEFVTNFGPSFTLTDGAVPFDSGALVTRPEPYSVVEEVPAGWDLVGSSCSDGSPPDAIVLVDPSRDHFVDIYQQHRDRPKSRGTCSLRDIRRGSPLSCARLEQPMEFLEIRPMQAIEDCS
ncbi:MAG: hypothetical protein L0Z62_48610, partial [Gemmataceae bacterium]|nr:hypothetical protein [Gemmataceae bacterium]